MADVTAEGQRADGSPAGHQSDTPSGHDARWARGLAAPARWTGRLIARHRVFSVVLLAAAALRAAVILGYPPVFWFNDSYNYVTDAVTGVPDTVRSNGYPFFLRVLLPFHSLYLLASLQALMGLAMGFGIYAVLRRRGLPWWGATLCALPVLFDVFELQLEHMIMSDVLFFFLITIAVVLLCWSDQPSWLTCVIVGLLVGYATLVRAVGEPLLVVVAVLLLVRRVNWKKAAALLVVGLLPIVGYMAWYHSYYGKYALDGSSGTFLYSRVSSFAECSKMPQLASNLRVLCDPQPPAQRANSQEYIWETGTPFYKWANGHQFTAQANSAAGKFAKQAILSQPAAYARVVFDDTMHTFAWDRSQSDVTGSGPSFQFRTAVDPVPWWATYYPGFKRSLITYGSPDYGQPKVVNPWSWLIIDYQKVFYLRGTMLAAILLIGLGGIVARWRRWGGLALLPWVVGVLLVVIPPLTAGFSYRYVLAAVPVSCLAAGLACSREPRVSRKAVAAAAVDASTTSVSPDQSQNRPAGEQAASSSRISPANSSSRSPNRWGAENDSDR